MQDKFSEVREHPRRKISGPIPGKIFLQGTRKEVPCEGYDVSKGGLSILTEHDILPETDLILVKDQHKIQLELVWGLSNFQDSGTYRYGLRTKNSDISLDELFIDWGC